MAYDDHMQQIQDFLRENGITLKKSLGQHFLLDESVLEDIITSANLSESDHVIEIGAGIGILTSELLKHVKHVTAIEIDNHLIPLLNTYIRKNELTSKQVNELTIVHKNALEYPFPSSPYKIVANIPYHITSTLLKHAYIETETKPETITLLIQKEVAQRICSDDNYGRLSILVRIFGEPKYIRTVAREAFLPPPKVDSAVIHITTYHEPIAAPKIIDEVFRITKIAFNQKRKMLRKTLGSSETGMEHLIQSGIDPARRPQTLTIEEWMKLANRFS